MAGTVAAVVQRTRIRASGAWEDADGLAQVRVAVGQGGLGVRGGRTAAATPLEPHTDAGDVAHGCSHGRGAAGERFFPSPLTLSAPRLPHLFDVSLHPRALLKFTSSGT